MTGKFIVFEGGDATGKSTQARLVAERRGAHFTFEPGDCSIGPAVREILLNPANESLSFRAEALLYAADRAQHVAEVIAPKLAEGTDVVCDRFIASSVIYQGVGRGLGADTVSDISLFATDALRPDLTVLLDVEPEVSAARLGDNLDRLERAGSDFHASVRQGFLDLAHANPDSWVVIDGAGSVDEVSAKIDAALAERLGE